MYFIYTYMLVVFLAFHVAGCREHRCQHSHARMIARVRQNPNHSCHLWQPLTYRESWTLGTRMRSMHSQYRHW